MKNKKRKWLAVLLMMSTFLFGCTSTEQSQRGNVSGLEEFGNIVVVARENGSGTRSTFAQLLGIDTAKEDSEDSDSTTKDALIVDSTEKVIAKVKEEKSAIAYISMGASESIEQGKVLKIDGKEASKENVEEGSYPLNRSFYIAYSGELSELQEDFLTYIKGKGQDIVDESYVAIAKSSSFLSNQAEGELVICGSTSAAPLLEELANEYIKINTHAQISVEQSDSTQGLTDVMQGKCDFGISSRELKDYEKELLDYEMIAKDGIEVIVNEDNPLEDISMEELVKIYTGEITAWNDLNNAN